MFKCSMLTASLALSWGCARLDARALVPSVVLRGAAERRGVRDGPKVRQEQTLRAEIGLAWSDPSSRRIAELVEPVVAVELEDRASMTRGLIATAVAAMLLAAAPA